MHQQKHSLDDKWILYDTACCPVSLLWCSAMTPRCGYLLLWQPRLVKTSRFSGIHCNNLTYTYKYTINMFQLLACVAYILCVMFGEVTGHVFKGKSTTKHSKASRRRFHHCRRGIFESPRSRYRCTNHTENVMCAAYSNLVLFGFGSCFKQPVPSGTADFWKIVAHFGRDG